VQAGSFRADVFCALIAIFFAGRGIERKLTPNGGRTLIVGATITVVAHNRRTVAGPLYAHITLRTGTAVITRIIFVARQMFAHPTSTLVDCARIAVFRTGRRIVYKRTTIHRITRVCRANIVVVAGNQEACTCTARALVSNAANIVVIARRIVIAGNVRAYAIRTKIRSAWIALVSTPRL